MKLDDELALHRDAVFSVGKVISVEGRRVRVAVAKTKNGSHLLYRGQVVRNVSVGSFVKITKGFVELIASVDGEHVRENPDMSQRYHRNSDSMVRELEVSLVGYLEGGEFQRGIREMPLLDNECFILSEEEFHLVHTFVREGVPAIQLGALGNEPTQPVLIGVDAIFGSHVGIFGNTGSGKSYTLAKLYHELFLKVRSLPGFIEKAQVVIIDFNGEYVGTGQAGGASSSVIADADLKLDLVLSTKGKGGQRLPLPVSQISDPTFWIVLLDATEKTQAPFLSRVLESDFWERKLAQPEDLLAILADLVFRATKSSDLSMDKQTVINLLGEVQTCLGEANNHELDELIDEFRSKLHYNSTQRQFYWGEWSPPYITSESPDWQTHTSDKVKNLTVDFSSVTDGIDLIRFKIVLQYYSDIISGFSNREHLSPLIKRMDSRVPDIKKLVEATDDLIFDKPMVVVSLKDVNLAMRKVIPMLLCKYLYDEKKRLDIANDRFLNLVIDEAHNILSTESSRESEAWRDYRLETFEEIIKEGRKFGVFLTIASQRPHDISPTIISQLHNYFLHRLVNDLDIKAIEKAVSYLDRVSFESMPILPTGTCILSGVAAQIPVRVSVGAVPSEYEPNSRTRSLIESWGSPPEKLVEQGSGQLDG